MPELYRGGFILADGRKVYISKRGLIEERPLAQWAATVQQLPVQWARWAYSADLLFFGETAYFKQHGIAHVCCASAFTEPATTPVDPQAWLLGGLPAAEVLPAAAESATTYRIGPVANGYTIH